MAVDRFSEEFLSELTFLNKDNKKLLSLIRSAYKAIMNVRLELAQYLKAMEFDR